MNSNASSSSSSSSSARRRALVLGGGGSTGNAWLIGVVAGLHDAGLDVTDAELTIGTSAGSTAAAQLVGAGPAELYLAALTPISPPPHRRPAHAEHGAARNASVHDHLERMHRIIDASADAGDLRRRIGSAALELPASSDDVRQAQWRATVAARLPEPDWPERAVLVTAIDAESGAPVVFDRGSGVELVDAVAASCSSGFAYTIGDRRYLDGGFRSNAENADLAAESDRVLVLSPFSGRSLTPIEWGTHLSTQLDELRAGGSLVETIFPESAAEHLFGANAMDLSLRPAAARAGYEQGVALAGRLTGFWG
ncbi:patatin-like phospholipase family protein [Agromyces sp. NPDC057679]|uniref:patatin-like phospholipase family protein n=1 Tax=Agromyces sp. NPDC057679 TaxID=3346207 RepID=UPI00366EA598